MALKDNKIFRWIIIPICIALCFVGIFLPGFGPLPQPAVHVLCIFVGVLTLWLTIGIDWPSLLCLFSLAFVRLTTTDEIIGFGDVLKNGFGDGTFLFLLFTFICTYALSKTSIIKRITLAFINSRLAKRSGLWFSFLFLFSVLLVGLVTSPSVLFVVVLPMLYEIFNIAKVEKQEKIGKALMMGLGFTVSIACGMTPIAHVFPVLAIEQLGDLATVSTGSYMLFAIPIGLIIFLLMFGLLFLIYRPDVKKLTNIDTSTLKNNLSKINKAEIITVIIFLIVIVLWVVVDVIKTIDPDKTLLITQIVNKFGLAMPPLFGVIALCIIRVDNKPILKVDEAFKNVPWASLVMCAGTLALGYMLKHPGVGLELFLKDNVSTLLGGLGAVALLIIFGGWASLQTNVASNIVTATLVSSIAVSVIPHMNTGLEITVVVSIIGFLSSLAFATPPCMPHIAIIGGSEYCTVKDVLIYGFILVGISLIITLGIGYPLGTLVM